MVVTLNEEIRNYLFKIIKPIESVLSDINHASVVDIIRDWDRFDFRCSRIEDAVCFTVVRDDEVFLEVLHDGESVIVSVQGVDTVYSGKIYMKVEIVGDEKREEISGIGIVLNDLCLETLGFFPQDAINEPG